MGIPEDLAQFEQSLNELVIKYEQYFLGLEKREPLKLLESVEALARKYNNINIVNTMLKFRFNSLVARFNSYRQHWNRILRLIEDGKYSREKFRMSLAKPETRSREEKPPVNPEVEHLYRQYIEARKACQLPTETVSREMIASALDRQKPAIMKKYQCEKVEFKVVIEDGAPKIKARPKK